MRGSLLIRCVSTTQRSANVSEVVLETKSCRADGFHASSAHFRWEAILATLTKPAY
jgi:hypothetical protein